MKADTKARERETHKPKMWVQVSWIRCYDIASRLRLCWLRFVIGNQPSAVRIFIRNMLGLRLYIDCVYLNKCVRVWVWWFVRVCECVCMNYIWTLCMRARDYRMYTHRDWIESYTANIMQLSQSVFHTVCVLYVVASASRQVYSLSLFFTCI